ncbi:MAG TPA: VWA domain-containing protein, partial [Bryobacteraceae bacterium]|nr:VWA domain-containing protein [Bryobacteraceae bacterium]
MFRFLVIFALLVAAIRAQESANKASDVVIRTGAQEVLLDFVARDKHNKLVTDLRPDEVQVFEDGVKQTPRSFQFRTGKQVFASRANERAPAMAVKPVYDPLREINLVSIVLERMSYDNRARATQAVRDFLRSGVLPNTYIGVFTLNHRLAVLQPWTTDLALLNRAVDRAATGNYLEFAKGS